MTVITDIQIGTIGVNSGCVVIGDPCYLVGEGDWSGVVDQMYHNGVEVRNEDGLPVHEIMSTLIVSTPNGDGRYPVYAEVEDGEVQALRIELGGQNDPNNSDIFCQGCGEEHDYCTCEDED